VCSIGMYNSMELRTIMGIYPKNQKPSQLEMGTRKI